MAISHHTNASMSSPRDHNRRVQTVLNESWPLTDEDGKKHARGRELEDRPAPRPVWARIEWENDGVQEHAAIARRWTDAFTHVFCTWDEPRLQISGVWLRASDIRRREEPKDSRLIASWIFSNPQALTS